MKHLYLFILYAVLSLQYASAQDGTSVSVHVDGERLENLLTDEQKKTVRDLRITGQLQADDYAYLRNSLFEQLDTLNLRDADIDTIPVRAFYGDYYNVSDKRIFLPAKLEHIADSAFCLGCVGCTLVLSGKYPTLGHNVYRIEFPLLPHEGIRFELSDDNMACKLIDDCIYSNDGTIAYYHNGQLTLWDDIVVFNEGTKVIYGHAFENRTGTFNVLIPQSVDSIGDRAFAGRYNIYVVRGRSHVNINSCVLCMAKVPPKLGHDVFGPEYLSRPLLVSDENEEAYRTADVWKEFDINPDVIPSEPHGIETPHSSSFSIIDKGGYYAISSIDNKIGAICIYNVSGQLTCKQTVDGLVAEIPKLILSYPYSMIRINYNDGTKESIKIKP